jgi:hypothetical protein
MNAISSWHNPVVAEIHATRERLAEQYHNDLLAYSKAAEAHCRALGLIMQPSYPLLPSTDSRKPDVPQQTR